MRKIRENPDYMAMFSDELLKGARIQRKDLKRHIDYMRGVLNPQRVDRMMWYFRLFHLALYARDNPQDTFECVKALIRPDIEKDPDADEKYLADFDEAYDEDDLPFGINIPESLYTFCEHTLAKGYQKAENKYNKKIKNRDKINSERVRLFVSRNFRGDSIFNLSVADLREEESINITREFTHFMSLNLPEINAVSFGFTQPATLYYKLLHLERVWQRLVEEERSKYKDLISDSFTQKHPVFLATNNPDFIWFDLESNKCEEEQAATGHCAHDAEGTTLLSLRERVLRDDNKIYWRVHVTTTLFSNGNIGQMKGGANSKPKEVYWPYIMEMLWDDRITGVIKGNYKAYNDFSVTWLPEDAQQNVQTFKPTLYKIEDYIELFGVDDRIREQIGLINPQVDRDLRILCTLNDDSYDRPVYLYFIELHDIFYRLGGEKERSFVSEMLRLERRDSLSTSRLLISRYEDQFVNQIYDDMPPSINRLFTEYEWESVPYAVKLIQDALMYTLGPTTAEIMQKTLEEQVKNDWNLPVIQINANTEDMSPAFPVAVMCSFLFTGTYSEDKKPCYDLVFDLNSFVKAYISTLRNDSVLCLLTQRGAMRFDTNVKPQLDSKAAITHMADLLWADDRISEDKYEEIIDDLEDIY